MTIALLAPFSIETIAVSNNVSAISGAGIANDLAGRHDKPAKMPLAFFVDNLRGVLEITVEVDIAYNGIYLE
jgi:hypothetical protein